MKKKKLTIEIEDMAQEAIYRKVMENHWQKIEEFRIEMERKIEADSRFYAEIVAKDLAEKIKQAVKENHSEE
jgi:hypothetical protein